MSYDFRVCKIVDGQEVKGRTKFVMGKVLNGFITIGSKGRYALNADQIAEAGLSKSQFELLSNGQIEAKYPQFRLKVGLNACGILIETQAQYEARKEDKAREDFKAGTPINFHHNIAGLTITDRLPKDIWAIVKPHAYYQSYEALEEWIDDQYGWAGADARDYVGWYYKDAAMTALMKAGYRVSYDGQLLDPATPIEEQMKRINDEANEAQRKAEAEDKAEREKKEALKEAIKSLEKEYPKSEELKSAEKLPEILAPTLGYNGANIYGGGSWFLIDADYLYIVQNNGMDGDDWSRNNLGTGGAGAICFRVKRSQAVDQVIARIAEADKTFADSIKQIQQGETDATRWAFQQVFAGTAYEKYADLVRFRYDWEDDNKKSYFITISTEPDRGYGREGEFIGLSLDKQYILLAKIHHFYKEGMTPIENEAWRKNGGYILGAYSAEFVLPVQPELLQKYQEHLPEWLEQDIAGRFLVKSSGSALAHSRNALRECIWRKHPVNMVAYNPDVRPLYRVGKGIIWNDGSRDKLFNAGESSFPYDKDYPPYVGQEISKLSDFHSELIGYLGDRLPLDDILQIEEKSIRRAEIKSQKGSNAMAALYEVKTNRGTFYEVEWAWWGGDDADDGRDWFLDKKQAEELYKNYA